MAAFAKEHGFRFVCHEKGHANRKAGEERSFWTVETNFLPGRHFSSLEDLNQQAFEWATVRMEHRPVAKTGLIPAQAFEQEHTALVTLPAHLPAPYLCHERRSEEHTSELQSRLHLVCRLLLEKKKITNEYSHHLK